MVGSKIFFAGSIQSISAAASPQNPSGSRSERAWTSWYRLLSWLFMALLPLPLSREAATFQGENAASFGWGMMAFGGLSAGHLPPPVGEGAHLHRCDRSIETQVPPNSAPAPADGRGARALPFAGRNPAGRTPRCGGRRNRPARAAWRGPRAGSQPWSAGPPWYSPR